ncbi:MAG: hypothetical protein DMF97_20710 [Acidobacteria bacterium]|nr:MAG: hypothetical protein DMF97_20710 [Acidobacteriota bacterium]
MHVGRGCPRHLHQMIDHDIRTDGSREFGIWNSEFWNSPCGIRWVVASGRSGLNRILWKHVE